MFAFQITFQINYDNFTDQAVKEKGYSPGVVVEILKVVYFVSPFQHSQVNSHRCHMYKGLCLGYRSVSESNLLCGPFE